MSNKLYAPVRTQFGRTAKRHGVTTHKIFSHEDPPVPVSTKEVPGEVTSQMADDTVKKVQDQLSTLNLESEIPEKKVESTPLVVPLDEPSTSADPLIRKQHEKQVAFHETFARLHPALYQAHRLAHPLLIIQAHTTTLPAIHTDVPDTLKCPFTHKPLVHPVQTVDGCVFSRAPLATYIQLCHEEGYRILLNPFTYHMWDRTEYVYQEQLDHELNFYRPIEWVEKEWRIKEFAY